MTSQLHQQDVFPAVAEANSGEPLDIPALTRRLVEGDEMAYRTFYEAYYGRLWRYLLVVTGGDEEAAREALQAALLRVVRHIKLFATEGAFWGWLTLLARSALADQSRKRRRYLAFLDRFLWHAQAQHAVADDLDADTQLLEALGRNLTELLPEEKQLVEWKYFERRSAREIAEELHTSEKAIESRLVRIRRKLKAGLLKELRDE